MQLYRLGFTGYILADISRYFLQLFVIWILFSLGIRRYYLRNKENIKKGEMWVLRMSYTFSYGFMIKMHESMFGLNCYSLLLQYSCLDFENILGIFSFITAILYSAYLGFMSTNVYLKLNCKQQKSQLWVANHMTPLVVQQGFINLNPENNSKFNLIKNYHLANYVKKIAVILCVYFGNSSSDFQLSSIIAIYTISLIYILYLRPYRSHFYTIIKIVAEISMILVCITLLISTKKIQILSE